MIYNMGAGVLRAVGDSKRPLNFLIVACVVNIVLDIAFVRVFPWGVFGVALSTVISQFISAWLVLVVLGKTPDSYHYELKQFGFRKDLLKRVVIIGLPMGIQSVLYSVSNLFIQSSVNGFGTDTIAAYTAFGKIDAFYWNMDSAIGTAVMTLAGQNFGARRIDRVKRIILDGIIVESVLTVIICVSAGVFGEPLIGMFSKDPDVIRIGTEMLRFMVKTWWLFIPIEILCSGIKACGDFTVPMVMTALGICVTRILWLTFYPYNTVIEALYCYPISWIITTIIFVVYYLQGGWLKKCIRKQDEIIYGAIS